jgi:histidyl-tRNA synthetase
MEAIGLGGAENAGRRLTVLRAIDKLDRLGQAGVRALLGEGRKDESGDFTKGAGLDDAAIGRVIAYTAARAQDNPGTLSALAAAVVGSAIGEAGLRELAEIAALAAAAGYGEDRILIDPAVVRGLEYYTGPVFEAELTFEVKDESGRPVRFGSVGGGGRYDGLVARFRAEPVPATGFSIGVSRLLAALRAIKSPIVAGAASPGPVVVVVLDRDHMSDYQRLVAALRAAGIASELYLGASGLNAQLKYADKRGSLCAVIQGSNERDAAGGAQVVIRDLALGAELAKANRDRADYLEMRSRAQATAPEAELVARVQEILARQGAPLLGA